MFSFKLFKNEGILAIADKDIIGKTFNKEELEITISKEFYHQDFCTEKEVLNMMNNAYIINAFGKNIVELMIRENIVKEDSVLNPCGIPHAQVFVA